jgi:hypothetical protein
MPKKHPIHIRVLSSRALREILDTHETIAANGHRARDHMFEIDRNTALSLTSRVDRAISDECLRSRHC